MKQIDRELDTLLNLILKGGAAEKINAKMVQLEKRKSDLEHVLSEAEEPPPVLHPEMAGFYRQQVDFLYEALQNDAETARLEAAAVLRSLIKDIVLTPEADELKIDVRGDLAGILTIAFNKKRPSERDGRVELGDLVEQVKMVAGERNQPPNKGRLNENQPERPKRNERQRNDRHCGLEPKFVARALRGIIGSRPRAHSSVMSIPVLSATSFRSHVTADARSRNTAVCQPDAST